MQKYEFRLVGKRAYGSTGRGNQVYQSLGAARRAQGMNGGELQSRPVGEWQASPAQAAQDRDGEE